MICVIGYTIPDLPYRSAYGCSNCEWQRRTAKDIRNREDYTNHYFLGALQFLINIRNIKHVKHSKKRP